jgi:hypothetical protein
VIVHDLSTQAVSAMTPVDLSTAKEEPPTPIGTFDFHGCTCGIGSFSGRPPWELHTEGDELLHILSGETELPRPRLRRRLPGNPYPRFRPRRTMHG